MRRTEEGVGGRRAEVTDLPTIACPEFEVTDPDDGAVRYLEHGYPSALVRWHLHNAYELHYIVASSGKFFVGDYVGEFHPGHLVLTGPRLPHNWISDTARDERFALRDMVVQFDPACVEGAAAQFPELADLLPLLHEARRGLEFVNMREQAEHYMHAIRDASGPSRLGYFCQFLHELARSGRYRVLSAIEFETSTDEAGLAKVDAALNYVMEHYQEHLGLGDVATAMGMSESYFSRFFRKATGNTFSEFLTRIRIGKACELLSGSDQQITSVCYEVGYNNVANFNRRFRERKGVTPREYRRQARRRLTRGGGPVEGPEDVR